MPKMAGNISIADQPVGLEEDLTRQQTGDYPAKRRRLFSRLISPAHPAPPNGIGNPLIFKLHHDLPDLMALVWHMQPI